MSGDLVAGELRGYRAWRQVGHLLQPMAWHLGGAVWATGTVTARCALGLRHDAPATGCRCGLYAYYRPTTVGPGVFGAVAVEGRVILATRGMKAERMRILGLVTDDEMLGRHYGVPIYPSREALLSDFPPQDYSGLVDVDPDDGPDPGTLLVNISASASGFQRSLNQAAGRFAQAMAKFGISLQEAQTTALERVGVIDKPLPEDRMQRALELRKRRNTGPAVGRYRLDGSR